MSHRSALWASALLAVAVALVIGTLLGGPSISADDDDNDHNAMPRAEPSNINGLTDLDWLDEPSERQLSDSSIETDSSGSHDTYESDDRSHDDDDHHDNDHNDDDDHEDDDD